MPENQPDKATDFMRTNQRYCPKCGESLKTVTVRSNVKAGPHQKNEGITADDSMAVYQTQFICQKCRLKYTIDDLRKIEKVYMKKNN